jgi:CheY-like chemotaxis protein
VVDDSDDLREVVTELLKLHGHQVEAVALGRQAVARAIETSPELVLVDVGLPDIDGHEVARQIRAALGPAPFLVAMTGHGREEDRRQALAAGFDEHLSKPVGAGVLEELVALGRPGR